MTYTLNDSIFIDSLLAGIEGANNSSNLHVYLVGGGAIQHYASVLPEFRRGTIDVDLQTKEYAPGSLRNEWATHVKDRLEERKRKATSSTKTKTGAEVRVETDDKSPFFIHLDMFTPNYTRRHQKIVDASFERKRELDLVGKRQDHAYFVQGPEDISYHKLKRLIVASGTGRLSPEDELLVRLLASGHIDNVVVGDLTAQLESLQKMRGMSLEEVAREGFQSTADLYNRFKDQKCLYDLRLLVAAHRQKPLFTDPRIIREDVEADESIVAHARSKGILS